MVVMGGDVAWDMFTLSNPVTIMSDGTESPARRHPRIAAAASTSETANTAVPGGVGAVTTAVLAKHLVLAGRRQRGN